MAQQGVVLRYHVQDAASTDGSQDVLASFAARIAADQSAMVILNLHGRLSEMLACMMVFRGHSVA